MPYIIPSLWFDGINVIIAYMEFSNRRNKGYINTTRPKRRKWPLLALTLPVIGVIGLGFYNLSRPLPLAQVTIDLPQPTSPKEPSLLWPNEGTAAVSAMGYDFIASNADIDETFSTASLIKLVASLCVLEKKPLAEGEHGPILTMTEADVAMQQKEVARNGNNIKIVAGEKMSQYHALEAILIESSNSTTDTLVIWAFGSMENYKAYAMEWLKKNGMNDTRLGEDASGMDPASTSNLKDMITLAKIARQNPVIMKIMATPTAEFQTHGTIYNRNKLGNDVLLGGKTGSLDDIKGSYLFMATTKTANPEVDVDIVGVIAYDSSVQGAIRDSEKLARSVASCFENITITRAGDSVGKLTTSWGASTPVTATKDLSVTRWCNSSIKLSTITSPSPDANSKEVGTLSATSDGKNVSTPLTANERPKAPDLWWRLTRVH